MAIASLFGDIGEEVTSSPMTEVLHEVKLKNLICKQSWDVLVKGYCSLLDGMSENHEGFENRERLANLLCAI